jgi:hypothetical protein
VVQWPCWNELSIRPSHESDNNPSLRPTIRVSHEPLLLKCLLWKTKPLQTHDSGLHRTVVSWKEQDVPKYSSAEDQSRMYSSFCCLISCAETKERQLPRQTPFKNWNWPKNVGLPLGRTESPHRLACRKWFAWDAPLLLRSKKALGKEL